MDTESFVDHVFSQLDFTVERVSESHDEERADYRLTDARHSYLVEVKDKFDAESMLAEYRTKRDCGDVYLRSESTGYKNVISNVFDKAESQLTTTALSEDDIRIVWLQLAGIDRKLHFQQTIATIYGTVQLLPIGPTVVTKVCFYFNYNVVHRNPGIDAIIICDGDSCWLATNQFSPRFGHLKSTQLYRHFVDHKAVVDPVALERSGDIYVADCTIPRNDSAAVLRYLQTKYNVDRFLDLQPTSTTASAEVRPYPEAT